MYRPHAHDFINCFERSWAQRWHLNICLVEEDESIVLLIPAEVFSKEVYEENLDPENVGSG